MFDNPFAFSPLGEKRTPQQNRLFDLFYGDDKKHAVIHGPECGGSIGALSLAVENFLVKGRDTLLVAPTAYKAIKLIGDEYGRKVEVTRNGAVAIETGARLRVFSYNQFTEEHLAGIEWGTVDLLIDGTFGYHSNPEQLNRAIDAIQPARMMTFDRASLGMYATGLAHPIVKLIDRYGLKVISLSSAESPLVSPEKLAFYRGFAAEQRYDVEKYISGEMF